VRSRCERSDATGTDRIEDDSRWEELEILVEIKCYMKKYRKNTTYLQR
jgi:hypothetical protein